ncbi:AfsR/SARP family transcriptional regulator [Actinomadura sp. WAC 06369]|uniref:AfsR/SARP family transcriptional regulator n=1 Tax=Actinomadura sp. WAC 06369 TaxID=2203193 RepID=UPI0013159EA1|nr:BTAD domain-containing putative transcriptional regulator [Actinomadura sp. WAC 06369]
MELCLNGTRERVGGPKLKIFLLALVVHRNDPVPLDRLAEAIWDDSPPMSATANIRNYAMAARRALSRLAGSEIVKDDGGYRLVVDPERVDYFRMEELVAEGASAAARGDGATAAGCAAEAFELNRGPVGHGQICGRGLAARLTALNEQRLALMEELVAVQLGLGGYAEAARHLRLMLGEVPLRERCWALLMRTLYLMGDTAGALTAFREARETLVELIGVEPGKELQDLHQAVLTRDPELAGGMRQSTRLIAPKPAGQPEGPSHRVPRQLPLGGRFSGRARELETLSADLVRQRALPAISVVSGSPGAGKSALALHAARRVADRFPDGQLYVDLGNSGQDERVTAAQAAVGFLRDLGDSEASEIGGLAEAVTRFRSMSCGLRLLILIDNAVPGPEVERLLPTGAGCAVLVTARCALPIDHARHIRLGAMGMAESIALLEDLAGTERVRADRDAAGELVRRCRFLPLALRAAGILLTARPDRPLSSVVAEFTEDASRILDRYGDPGVNRRLRTVYQRVVRDIPEAKPLLSASGDATITTADAARMLGGSSVRILDRLCDECLIEPTPEGGYRAVPLLGLLQNLLH